MAEELPEDDGLSEYERNFLELYMGLAEGNGARAVEMLTGNTNAHSCAVTASRILKRPHVKAAMRARTENDPRIMGRLERLWTLTEIARGESTEERVFMTKEGPERLEVGPTHDQRMAAIDRLEKAAGFDGEREDDAREDDVKKATFSTLFNIITGKIGEKKDGKE